MRENNLYSMGYESEHFDSQTTSLLKLLCRIESHLLWDMLPVKHYQGCIGLLKIFPVKKSLSIVKGSLLPKVAI